MRPERQRGWLIVLLFLLDGVKTWHTIIWTKQWAAFTDLSSSNYMCEGPASHFPSLGFHMGKIRCSQKSH